jgi:hypothetical protein
VPRKKTGEEERARRLNIFVKSSESGENFAMSQETQREPAGLSGKCNRGLCAIS